MTMRTTIQTRLAAVCIAALLAGCSGNRPSDPPEAQAEAVEATEATEPAVNNPAQAGAAESAPVSAAPAPNIAVQGGHRLGDRRLVRTRQWSATNSDGEEVIRCEVYEMVDIDLNGNKAPKWRQPWALELESRNIRECQNAINRDEFFQSTVDSGKVETLDSVDNLVSAIREKRGWINNGRAHACGTDGLVYDVFPDGTARRHTTTLQYPNKRCRITPKQKVYRGAPLDTILSIGGE